MNSCPWAPFPPHLTRVVTSPHSQSQGWPGRALVGWHVPAGPQPSSSLPDAPPKSRKPGGVRGLKQSCWGRKEVSAASAMGSGPRAQQRLQETWKDSVHIVSHSAVTPRTLPGGTQVQFLALDTAG